MEMIRQTIGLLSVFVIPLMLVGFPVYGLYKRVPVYEAFVEGAKEGFTVAVRIIPYLVAILFAIGMFRASGAMEFMTEALRVIVMFGEVSAFASCGLSMGFTGGLDELPQALLIYTMYNGRLGPLTFALALAERFEGRQRVRYPEGEVNIG